MDKKMAGLVSLVDKALELAETRLRLNQTEGKPRGEPRGALETITGALQILREKALRGELESSEGRVTLGLSREILDWDDWDSPLAKAIGRIEQYYQEVWK